MRKIMKDYKDLVYDPQIEFIKRHWKGYTLTTVGIYAVVAGGLYISVNKDKIKNMIKPKKEN